MSVRTITPIEPYNLAITSICVNVQNITLNTRAYISCLLYHSTDVFMGERCFYLEGQDYTNWSNDDNYLINYAANLYGFTIIPSVPSAPSVPVLPEPVVDPVSPIEPVVDLVLPVVEPVVEPV